MKQNPIVLLVAIVLSTGAASCAERTAPANDAPKPAIAVPQPTGGAPGVLRVVVTEDGTDIFVLLQNQGDEPITLNPEVTVGSPEPNISLVFDPLKSGMAERPQSRGYAIRPDLGSTNIVLFRNRLYGTSYNIASLKDSMRIPAGCYSLTVRYQNLTRPEKYFSEKVESKPVKVCFPESSAAN